MEIAVSIICNTYNQEVYIRDALEGFVKQKCSFNYEILIHDDASTDRTVDIIREYERLYPNLISAIYQTQNQYSQGVNISKTYQYPRVRGKYIAFCEGDDFWNDEYKLQKQYDAMEKNLNVDICSHVTTIIKNGKKIGKIEPVKKEQIIPVEKVIAGGGAFVATNSLMFRTELLKDEMQFQKVIFFDYVLQIRGALKGGMLFLIDNMSTYREAAIGSWTLRMMKNPDKRVTHLERVKTMLQKLNEETNYQYNNVINKKILHVDFEIYFVKREYATIWKRREVREILSPKEKLKLIFKTCVSFVSNN